MKYLLTCRRTFVAIFGIICLTALGFHCNLDVSLAISGIVLAIAGANSAQAIGEKRYEKKD